MQPNLIEFSIRKMSVDCEKSHLWESKIDSLFGLNLDFVETISKTFWLMCICGLSVIIATISLTVFGLLLYYLSDCIHFFMNNEKAFCRNAHPKTKARQFKINSSIWIKVDLWTRNLVLKILTLTQNKTFFLTAEISFFFYSFGIHT